MYSVFKEFLKEIFTKLRKRNGIFLKKSNIVAIIKINSIDFRVFLFLYIGLR